MRHLRSRQVELTLATKRTCSQRDDVKSAFHATRHAGAWTECNGQVGANFYTPHSLPSVTLLPDLLTKIQVLMFAGAEDLICVRRCFSFPFLPSSLLDLATLSAGKGLLGRVYRN